MLTSSPPPGPALALDWGRTEDGLVEIRAASLRGANHGRDGGPRQDAYALAASQGSIHVAVADGVGTARRSEVGSDIAARTAVRASLNGADVRDIGPTVAAALGDEATRRDLDSTDLLTTLCWLRCEVGAPQAVWQVEAASWGDTEVLVYDTRQLLDDSHPHWTRPMMTSALQDGPPNEVAPLPTVMVPVQARHWDWEPGQVICVLSDGIALDVQHNSKVGHALAEVWYHPPDPLTFASQMHYQYLGATDDRTGVVLWRNDTSQQSPTPQSSVYVEHP